MTKKPSIVIRSLKSADVPAWRRLFRATLRGLADRIYPAEFMAKELAARPDAWFADKLAKPNAVVLGAFAGDRLVGFVFASSAENGLFYIEWLGVAPSVRRQGVASRFLKRMARTAAKAKCHKLYLLTSRKNVAAISCYLGEGYELEGTLDNHYYGVDFVMMSKTLERKIWSTKYAAVADFPLEPIRPLVSADLSAQPGKRQAMAYRDEAAKMARLAQCLRARCGAVIVAGDGEVIGRGYNAPPLDDATNARCDTDYRVSPKPKSDRTCCVHAEWRAIIDALRRAPAKVQGATLYFTRVDEAGLPKPSGNPYCTVCSRLALDVGLAYFVLFHDDGPEFYPTDEYNWKSYEYHRP